MKGVPLGDKFRLVRNETKNRKEHPKMSNHKYVALDVDSANIVAGVYDSKGKALMQCCIKMNAQAVREFFKLLSGTVHVTFEEGTQAAWLYELVHPLVAEVIVCNPRQNQLMKAGNKSDRIDVAKMAKLLRLGELRPVYQGAAAAQGLKQLAHGYQALVGDSTRVMNRLKAIYRSRGLSCTGETVYEAEERDQWLAKLKSGERQRRAETLYAQLDCLLQLRAEAEKELGRAARRHEAYKWICSTPGLGPIRTAQILATVITPHRFRDKRQFWPYCGLAVVTRSSSDYEWVGESSKRKRKRIQTWGLNQNYNRTMKAVFKAAALSVLVRNKEFREYYQKLCEQGMRPEMAQLTIARKLAAIVLILWKKGERYDSKKLKQAAPGTGQAVQ
jgi:transposase